jgi:hypothetical protein
MMLHAIEPHATYKNLDTYHFRCACGSFTTAVVARQPEGQRTERVRGKPPRKGTALLRPDDEPAYARQGVNAGKT